ncbi:MAG: TIGR01777 family oxidoreductase, partial [Pseudobdellovibrionaceae bacterium]
LGHAPEVFVSASAIGFYGDQGEENLTENSAPGKGFLPDVCVQWENEIFKMQNKFPATRIVAARIGIVLAREGGALPQMAYPFRVGVGGALSHGRQWMSWIHIEDILGLFHFCLENKDVKGAINFVAPEPATNQKLSELLAKSLNRPLGLRVPKFALNLLYGELSAVLLSSQKVSCETILRSGYKFQFLSLEAAFDELCSYWKKGEDLLVAEQFIPATPREVFPFFADAKNLEQITPKSLNFNVLRISTPQVEKGTLIDYKLKLHGVPLSWRTLIEDWEPGTRFVDTQLKGPYQLWHHTHTFEPMAGGTLMTDTVRYKLPMGYLGWLTAGLWVKSDVQKIFDFRRSFISEMKF